MESLRKNMQSKKTTKTKNPQKKKKKKESAFNAGDSGLIPG